MAGRELVFADPDVIKLVNARFVPVTADDWYERRREDEVGRFFRSVADQGPRNGQGGSTRQGIYCFTASGKLLNYKNAQDPQVMLAEFRKALAAWDQLPVSERKPGAVVVHDLAGDKLDRHFTRKLPDGAVVVEVNTRIVERGDDGQCRKCQAGTGGSRYGTLAAQDHLWLTREDVQSLVKLAGRESPGKAFTLPAAIAQRMARFHLVDNTRGEPPMWDRTQLRSCEVTLTVLESTPKVVRLRLDGSVLLSTQADVQRADRGYDARLLGYVDLDVAKGVLTRFDVLVLGDHWGQGTYTRGARPGRAPLAVAMQLARGNQPADLVPPQAARDLDGYLRTGRE